MKILREVLTVCVVATALQALPHDAYAFDIVYPPGAPKIASDYDADDDINGRRRSGSHKGIDITGRDGQPILAAADGTVLEATVEDCWGPTIAVDHGIGLDGKKMIALYGHVGEMLVSEGAQIKRGDVIARLGDYSYQCIYGIRHLHFQLGQKFRAKSDKGGNWGWAYFLENEGSGRSPHRNWADGPGKVTCFDPKRAYPPGSLTYPVPCS